MRDSFISVIYRVMVSTNIQNKKVFVGMSGGVDSSVSASLLKKAGYDVRGVFIRVWQPETGECTWKDERRDAMRVAAHLDIPFMTLDLREEYKKGVVDYMIEEYKNGRKGLLGLFMGEAMKLSGGRADPKLLQKLVKETLDKG